ncbi:glycosyltransferase [Candidatus Pacearchaeota archaeon]|nr:glycosyltransferase [Candidatus Pacearchaeota archaeon]
MLSIIIPAHNEEKRIGPTLEVYGKFFSDIEKKQGLRHEIIIVLNACKDNTIDIVKEYSRKYKKISYIEFVQGGKGFAVTEGFKHSLRINNEASNLIGFVDADMATSPSDFYQLAGNIGNYDGIIASRWMKKSVIDTPQTFLRKLTSRGFNFITRVLFFMPYKDTQCGAKIFKRNVIEIITPKINITQWAFDINLLYLCKRNNFRIKEHPTVWNDKSGSKINLVQTPMKMFLGVLRLRILYSPLNFIVRFYNKIPEVAKIHHKLTG